MMLDQFFRVFSNRFLKPTSFLLTAATLIASSSQVGAQPQVISDLDGYIGKALREWDTPGLAVAIIRNDSVLLAKGYGVRKLGDRAKVDEQTIFAIASTTKPMTVACLGMLVDEGKLKWDDPVTKYLPDFRLEDPWVTREITIRDLLTHRTGLDRCDNLWYATSYDRQEIIRRLRFVKPTWSFRTHVGYQNVMYMAAGEIVQAITGKSWDEFVKERLFVPLGMNSSSTDIKDLASHTNTATPHEEIDGAMVPVPLREVGNLGGAGSVNSDLRDMIQWIRLILNEGTINGKRILSKAVVEEMLTPQVPLRLDSLIHELHPSTHFVAYGFGWVMSDYHGRKVVQHNGALDGIRTRIVMMPEEKIGLVFLSNGTKTVMNIALEYRIFDTFLGASDRDWSQDLLKISRTREEKRAQLDQRILHERVLNTSASFPLEAYAGKYESDVYGLVTLSMDRGKLVFTFGPHYRGELDHWHYDVFRINWHDKVMKKVMKKDRLVFSMGFDGKVKGLEWEGVGEFTRKMERP